LFVFAPDWNHLFLPCYIHRHVPVDGAAPVSHCPLVIAVVKAVVYTLIVLPAGLVVNLVLHATKLHGSPAVAGWFWHYWNDERLRLTRISSSLLLEFHHTALLLQLLMGTIPILVMQILNNADDGWNNALSMFAFLAAALMLATHSYRYIYYLVWKRLPLQAVPLSAIHPRGIGLPSSGSSDPDDVRSAVMEMS